MNQAFQHYNSRLH